MGHWALLYFANQNYIYCIYYMNQTYILILQYLYILFNGSRCFKSSTKLISVVFI